MDEKLAQVIMKELVSIPDNQEANIRSVSINQVHHPGKKLQNQTLTRHHSTPARLKSPNKQSDVQTPNSDSGTKMEGSRSNSLINHHPIDRFQVHRHSHSSDQSLGCLNHHQQKHHLHHHHHNNENHKSTSPSNSSSASDSAFSQSQTTLESEIDQTTSCFRQHCSSLHTNDSLSNEIIITEPIKKLTSSSSFGNHTTSELSETDDSNQFKIIWRNLSYKVPEKRFARLSACLSRHRQNLWPQKVQEEEKYYNNNSITIESDVQKNDNFDELPLHAPTIGKPRRVIFSSLNGCVKSGQLTAILGPSGAGKTTFLKCLTNSIVKGVSGSIDIAGGSDTSHLKLCIIPQKGELADNSYLLSSMC